MKKSEEKELRCPHTNSPMTITIFEETADEIISGEFQAPDGNLYTITEGIPDLSFPKQLPKSDAEARKMYDDVADIYDEHLPLTFMTFSEDEQKVRNEMVDRLHLKPHHRVLEIGAGTGRDSELIAARLNKNGNLHLQDLSLKILKKSFPKLQNFDVPITYSVFNACFLPFPDNYFDAVYHFGGLNTFSDIGRSLREINRVTKTGGRVVVGDESMPPWLRETEFGKILMNSNHHYRFPLPLDAIPVTARDVCLRWILGGVFYVFDYSVAENEPSANFDFQIPGNRGGTHRTRFHGMLEGVSEETKTLAYAARKKTGKSMHMWLNDVLQDAAKRDLEQTK